MKRQLILPLLLVLFSSCREGNPTLPPVPPSATTLSARLMGNSVELKWNQSPDQNFLRYRLYRASTPYIYQSPDQATILFVTENRTERIFVDQGLQPGYWYYAVQVENTENLTTWSNEVGVRVTEGSK